MKQSTVYRLPVPRLGAGRPGRPEGQRYNMAVNRSFMLLLLLAMLMPVTAAAQAVAPHSDCHLPAGLWQQRQAMQREFDKSGGQSAAALEAIESIDAKYRGFVLAVGAAYEQKQPQVVNACCNGVRGDPEASIFCSMVRYRLGGRKDPAPLLAALPETPEAASALVYLGQAASRDGNAPAIAGSPVFEVTNDVFHLMLAGNSDATAKYFYLFRHSGGAYADDVADQLEGYLTDHRAALVRNWPVLRKYWNLSDGITWDVDAGWWQGVIGGFRRVCNPGGASCKQIMGLLDRAARAAGAPH